MMERLTKRIDGGIERVCHHYPEEEKMCYGCVKRTACNAAIFDRLAYYEDMEEQGRLQIFPCAPGATVYATDVVDGKAVPCEVLCFGDIDGSGDMTVEYKMPKEIPNIVSMLCGVSEFGKTLFLTREEAENALKGGDENA